MNGILNGMPTGILNDPRQAAMLQAGLGLLQSSGPSRMPVSLGQAIGQAGTQGLNAFQQLQQAQLQEEMRRRQMIMQEQQLRLQQERANRPSNPMVAAPGSWVIDPKTGQPMSQVPFKPEKQEPVKPPMTRTVQKGTEKVTEEYVNGKWQEIGRGPMFQPTKSAAAPRAPTGFRYKDGSEELEAIPGGPKDTSKKDISRLETAKSRADLVIGKVDDALNKVGFFTTGVTGALMGLVPGTDAYDLRRITDTIKANIGFQELQAMREASPTGGALGQVAVQELNMLQAVLSSLDANQSDEELKKSLLAVKKHYEGWKAAVAQANAQSNAGGSDAAPTDAPKRRVYNPKSGKFE